MTIVATGTVSGFFHEVVEDAIRSNGVQATEVATNYLVSLLADFARPDTRAEATLDRPLAFLLDEAIHTKDQAERFERLRTLGDGVLYTSGFFGDHFEARGVDQKYLIGIGTTAYSTAGAMLRAGESGDAARAHELDLFGELTDKFPRFVEVFVTVADATIAMGAASSRSLLKVYERWLKTGSGVLAQTLSSHGLVPTRGTKGVLQ